MKPAAGGLRIGVDLGGTKIEALALAADGTECWRRRVATPHGDYAGTLDAVAALVRAAEDAVGGRATVGIGHPGAISPFTGLIKNSNSTDLNGRPMREDMARVLGRPVRLANDADCLAVSEAADGAGAGARSVFAVILGTGCGGGIVIDGRLVTGPNAIAGEWGHNPLPAPVTEGPHAEIPGPPCSCGKAGHVEAFISGTGIERDLARVTGRVLKATEIAARASADDADCRAALDRHADRTARALAAIVNVLDPHVIVIGGGVSRIAGLCPDLEARLPAYVFSDRVVTRIVPAAHGDSSGVRGAAWLWSPAEAADPP